MDDVETLRDLLRSVYLTSRQKQALGRVLRTVTHRPLPCCDEPEDRGILAAIHRATNPLSKEPDDSAVEEDERHALLGPCGAE